MSESMQFAVSMGFDAMRIALGGQPKTHSVNDVIRWLRIISKTGATKGTGGAA